MQVETRRAIDRVGAIAAVEGVDGVFIGPADLAADLGHLGDIGHTEVQDAIAAGARDCLAAGKPIGIMATGEADARRYIDIGFTFIALGSDLSLLARHSTALAAAFNSG